MCCAQQSCYIVLAQVLQAMAYVFCADLQSVPQGGAHSVAFINFALVQDTRPTTSDWPTIAPEGPHIYARIAIRFCIPPDFVDQRPLTFHEGVRLTSPMHLAFWGGHAFFLHS